MRSRNPVGWLIDHPWYLVLIAGVTVFTMWALGTRRQPYHVTAHFNSAFNLVTGQAVSVDGQEVGKISSVKYDNGKALVGIGISDKRFRPLHAGTRVVSRWGTTIGSGTRRIDLVPGPDSAPVIHDGGIIPTEDTQEAVDVDLVLDSLTKNVRGHLQSMVRGLDQGFTGHTQQMGEAIHSGSAGVEATGDVMADLSRDSAALGSMITNGRKLTRTLAARSPRVEGLLTVAQQTFDTFARNTRATQDSIQELAPTLDQTKTTLARLDTSVGKLDGLVGALAPGAARLTPVARTAQPALAQLRTTLPTAVDTVEQTTRAAPKINDLLAAASPFAKMSPGVFGDLAPMVACIRPYAPDAANAIVGGAGWTQVFDLPPTREGFPEAPLRDAPVAYVGRRDPATGRPRLYSLAAMPMVSTESFHSYPLTPKQFVDLGGSEYAFPRPPGLSTGHPWFIPECGITKDALDPSKDAEYHR